MSPSVSLLFFIEFWKKWTISLKSGTKREDLLLFVTTGFLTLPLFIYYYGSNNATSFMEQRARWKRAWYHCYTYILTWKKVRIPYRTIHPVSLRRKKCMTDFDSSRVILIHERRHQSSQSTSMFVITIFKYNYSRAMNTFHLQCAEKYFLNTTLLATSLYIQSV